MMSFKSIFKAMKIKDVLDTNYIRQKRSRIIPYGKRLTNKINNQVADAVDYLRITAADNNFPLTNNDRKLAALKDKHKGEKCVIVGNGPSLKISDLNQLQSKEFVTFGFNKIYLAFEETDWRPTYYMASDLLFLENYGDTLLNLKLTKLLPDRMVPYIKNDLHTIFYKEDNRRFFQKYSFPSNSRYKPAFCPNALETVFSGHMVPYNALQIAFFMGIREVYLIGMDHSWVLPTKQRKDTQNNRNRNVLVSEGENNHFHPDYHELGESWAIPDIKLKDISFTCAKQFYETHGGIIYNATRGGKLEIFTRKNLDDIL